MKKTIVILSIILSLFSLSSCNLDNEGILWRNIDRTVSDNKNRNFIGATGDAFYFVTENGLEKGTVNGDSYSETVVSTNDIFTQFYQGFGFISGNSIIYLDDIASENQNFYKINLETYAVEPLTCSVTGITFVSYYVDGGNTYLIGKDGNGAAKVYSVPSSVSSTELTLTEKTEYNRADNYYASFNGLIRTGSEYVYNGITIQLKDKEVTKSFPVDHDDGISFAVNENNYFIIQNDGSSFYVYKAMKDVGSIVFEQIASISRSYRRQQFASFASNDKLYFVQHSGTNSASQFITVSTGPDAEGNYTVTSTNTVNGMEAEAFFTLNDSITYMLSKNHGLFKVENSSLVKL